MNMMDCEWRMEQVQTFGAWKLTSRLLLLSGRMVGAVSRRVVVSRESSARRYRSKQTGINSTKMAMDLWLNMGLKSMPARICTVKPSGNAAVNLGCSSGVHFEHSKRFIRRVQAPKSSPIVQAYLSKNPDAVEESVWSQLKTDHCLAFAIEAPEGALTREEHSAVDFLNWVRRVQSAWVANGVLRPESVEGLTHNVSNTCTVRPDEWDAVAQTLLEGRSAYGGVSCISASGDYDYPQPPFQAIYSPEEIAMDDPLREAKLEAYAYWRSLREASVTLSFDDVVEHEDNTTLSQELACSGGACELSLSF